MKRISPWVLVTVLALAALLALVLLWRNTDHAKDPDEAKSKTENVMHNGSESPDAANLTVSSERDPSWNDNPSYFIVGYKKMGSDLEGSTNKILEHFFGLRLPASARNFGQPRHNEFQMDPGDAEKLYEGIVAVLSDQGPYKGTGIYFNPDKWKHVIYGETIGMPPGHMIPNPKDGPYKIIQFMPQLEGRAKEEAARRDEPPTYEMRINLGNGFATMSLSSYD